MNGYNYGVTKGEVKAVKAGESFLVAIDGKIACSMATGGAHRFRNEAESEYFGRSYVRGYTAGTFLSDDVSNFI